MTPETKPSALTYKIAEALNEGNFIRITGDDATGNAQLSDMLLRIDAKLAPLVDFAKEAELIGQELSGNVCDRVSDLGNQLEWAANLLLKGE